MLVLGHRGAPDRHLENTLPSFRAAMALGADGVELDARRTSDDQLVVYHDARLPGYSVPIDKLTLDQVRAARLPRNQRVPTLEEALDAVGPAARVVVELKGRSAPKSQIAQVLGPSGRRPGICVSSFNHRMVASSWFRSYPVALTVDQDAAGALEKAERLGATEVHVRHDLIDSRLVARARKRDLRVIAWTADTAEQFDRLAHVGADGIITNRVEMALEFFRKKNNRGMA